MDGDDDKLYGSAAFKSGLIRAQRGRGPILDWFRRSYTFIKPFVSRGLKTVGSELLSSGSKALGEIAEVQREGVDKKKKTAEIVKRNLKGALTRAARQTLQEVNNMSGTGGRRKKRRRKAAQSHRKMTRGAGSSIKGAKKTKSRQSKTKSGRARTQVKRLRYHPDIFGSK